MVFSHHSASYFNNEYALRYSLFHGLSFVLDLLKYTYIAHVVLVPFLNWLLYYDLTTVKYRLK